MRRIVHIRPLTITFVCCLSATVWPDALNVAGAAQPADSAEIGITVVAEKSVIGTLDRERRPISQGQTVHLNEIVETGEDAQGEFELRDETKLAVGPNSTLTLDKFVFDPDASTGSVALNLTKGTFRFITGKLDSASYELRTPTATMGIRGTVFDVFVDDRGEMAVLLHSGSVEVCARPSDCRLHRTVGRFFHIGRRGRIRGPLKWDGTFMPNVRLNRAFPFVERRLRVDPVRRLKRADLLGGRALRRAARPAQKATRKATRAKQGAKGATRKAIRATSGAKRATRKAKRATQRPARAVNRRVRDGARNTRRNLRRVKPF